MPNNYPPLLRPPIWVSAHRKNEFKMRLPQGIISSGYNSGGFLKLNLSGAFPYPVSVGDRIYITAGSYYSGYNTIKEVNSSVQITLNTSWNPAYTIGGSIPVWQVKLPVIRIYKGYNTGELIVPWGGGNLDFSTVQPYTLVGEFQPESGADGYITFDVSGYLKTVIETPYRPAYNPDETNYLYPTFFGSNLGWYPPKYYNRVRVVQLLDSGIMTRMWDMYVANSAITTAELNREFVDTQRQLAPLTLPVKYFGQYFLGDYIEQNLLIAKLTS